MLEQGQAPVPALAICSHTGKGSRKGFAPALFENRLHYIWKYIINNPDNYAVIMTREQLF